MEKSALRTCESRVTWTLEKRGEGEDRRLEGRRLGEGERVREGRRGGRRKEREKVQEKGEKKDE